MVIHFRRPHAGVRAPISHEGSVCQRQDTKDCTHLNRKYGPVQASLERMRSDFVFCNKRIKKLMPILVNEQ